MHHNCRITILSITAPRTIILSITTLSKTTFYMALSSLMAFSITALNIMVKKVDFGINKLSLSVVILTVVAPFLELSYLRFAKNFFF
jgi:hypothetical protein